MLVIERMIASSFITLATFGRLSAIWMPDTLRGDRLGFAAVFVARLGAERFELARPAAHPEQDARHAAPPQILGRQADRVGPAHHAGRRAVAAATPQEIPPVHDAVAIGPGMNECCSLRFMATIPDSFCSHRDHRDESEPIAYHSLRTLCSLWLILIVGARTRSNSTGPKQIFKRGWTDSSTERTNLTAFSSSSFVGSRDSVRKYSSSTSASLSLTSFSSRPSTVSRSTARIARLIRAPFIIARACGIELVTESRGSLGS